MKVSFAKFSSRMALGVTATMLASCALPPKEAWRVIRNDGLFPYIAMEVGNKPFPSDVSQSENRYVGRTAPAPAAEIISAPASASAPVPVVASNDESKTTPHHAVTPRPMPRLLLNNKPVAEAYTPAKPKHAEESAPAPKPKAEVAHSEPAAPKVVKPAPAPTPPPVVAAKPKTEPKPMPKVEAKAEVKKEMEKPKAVAESKPAAPKTTQPAPAKKEEPAKPAAPKVESKPSAVASTPAKEPSKDELPYGTPVPGRPGLVNSPYAGKMQLVDVTGLKPGQEVKCPYSGKLFRVPPGAMASQKPDEKK